MTDTARIAANLVLSVAQPFAGNVSRLTGEGKPIDQRAETYTPVTPIGPAFGIWGPLFASHIYLSARAARAKHRDSKLLHDIGWLSAAAYAANTGWELQAELDGLEPQSNAIIASGAVAACAAILIAERGDYPEDDRKMVRFPLGVLAGWLTAATAANVEASRVKALGRPDEARGEEEAITLIAVTSLAAAGMTVATRGSLHYAGGAAWGLGGVIVRNLWEDRPRIAVAAALGIGGVLAAALWTRRGR